MKFPHITLNPLDIASNAEKCIFSKYIVKLSHLIIIKWYENIKHPKSIIILLQTMYFHE